MERRRSGGMTWLLEAPGTFRWLPDECAAAGREEEPTASVYDGGASLGMPWFDIVAKVSVSRSCVQIDECSCEWYSTGIQVGCRKLVLSPTAI